MLWLAASYMEFKATIQEGVMNFIRLFNNLERVEQFKTLYQKHTLMTQKKWNVMVSSRI